MAKRSSSFVIGAAAAASLVLTALIPPAVLAQRQAVQKRETIYHGVLHIDFIETYDLVEDSEFSHEKAHNELTMKYDLTQDFHIVGEHDLGELPGKPAVPVGSFHVIFDSSRSADDKHETYKLETAGAIAEGGFGFETPGPGDEYITARSVLVPRNCVSKGNLEPETDLCGDVGIPELSLSRINGQETIKATQDLKLGAFKATRPADMDEAEDYQSPYWPAGVISGTVASGFTVDMTDSKTMHVVPASVGGTYTCVLKKTLKVSIRVNPSGKTGYVPRSVEGNVYTDITALIEPKFALPFGIDHPSRFEDAAAASRGSDTWSIKMSFSDGSTCSNFVTSAPASTRRLNSA